MITTLTAFIAMTSNARELVTQSFSDTHVVAHRGGAAHNPENTLAAFTYSAEHKFTMAECDVWMSSDAVPMIMHDQTLDRTTSLKGDLANYTSQQLKEAGVPSLAEVLEVTKGKTVLVIELKGGKGVVAASVDVVKKAGQAEHVIFFSFDRNLIAEVEKIDSKLFSVWLCKDKWKSDASGIKDSLAAIGADGIGFGYKKLVPTLPEELRKLGIPVFVWTVPPGEEVERLAKLRVNFIITDSPLEVRGQLERFTKR